MCRHVAVVEHELGGLDDAARRTSRGHDLCDVDSCCVTVEGEGGRAVIAFLFEIHSGFAPLACGGGAAVLVVDPAATVCGTHVHVGVGFVLATHGNHQFGAVCQCGGTFFADVHELALVTAFGLFATGERNVYVTGNAVEFAGFVGDGAEVVAHGLPGGNVGGLGVVENHNVCRRGDDRFRVVRVGRFVLAGGDGRGGSGLGENKRCHRAGREHIAAGDGDVLALEAVFLGLYCGCDVHVADCRSVKLNGGLASVDDNYGDGVAGGACEGDRLEVVFGGGGRNCLPARIHELGVMTHGVVFRANHDFVFFAAAPAFGANADKLAAAFAPEELPGDVATELTVGKADLHNVGETHHVFFASLVEHVAELGHNNRLAFAAVSGTDSLHGLAVVFGSEVVVAGVVVAVTGVIQVVGVAVQLVVVEFLGVLFEVAVANTERLGAQNFGSALHGVIDCIQSFFVAGRCVCFGGVEQGFFVVGIHVRFVLKADVVRCDTRGLVGFEALFPPGGKVTVGVSTVGIATDFFQGVVGRT